MRIVIAKVVVLTYLATHYTSSALANAGTMDECLLDQLKSADASTTVGMLTKACESVVSIAVPKESSEREQQQQSVVAIRRDADAYARSGRFLVSTHRPNYIIATHNDKPNVDPFDIPEGSFDQEEMKFQVSFKMPVATELFGGDTDLMFGYTAVSWWQLFNEDADNPFRETNYEPELYFQSHADTELLGLDFINWEIGVNHQSNGQSGDLSRGWDRAIASTTAELSDDIVLGVRAWHVLDRQDRNRNLTDYMGYGDLGLGWVPNKHTFTFFYRPAAEGDAVQLTWSYPITRYLRLYAQYWNGYGESLIDYSVRSKRLGIGLALGDVISRD
jgi:phospholipase A1/A2